MAESEDFPTETFLYKALEGMAKQVPVDTIAEVLRTRLGYCTTGRAILGGMPGIERKRPGHNGRVHSLKKEPALCYKSNWMSVCQKKSAGIPVKGMPALNIT